MDWFITQRREKYVGNRFAGFEDKKLSSMCELYPYRLSLEDNYKFWRELCQWTEGKINEGYQGKIFDFNVLQQFYEYMYRAFQKRQIPGHTIYSFPADVKCAIDYASGLNSYEFFCNFSDCSSNSNDYFYVPEEFCGDTLP